MKVSAHLDSSEIVCKCGCGRSNLSKKAIDLFEAVRHKLGDRPLYVTSACRCSKHSVAVGGYADDQHVKGNAFDVYSKDFTPEDIAEAAELCGANGIGLMSGAVHFDAGDRLIPWRGNEKTGANVATFIRKSTITKPIIARFTIGGKSYTIQEE